MASSKTSRHTAKAGSNGVHSGNGAAKAAQRTATKAAPRATAGARLGALLQYAPAPETVKVTIAPTYGHFIGGAFAPSSGGETFATINPATETVLSRVAQGTQQDVDRAVQAARGALPAWQALPGAERGKYLFRLARRIQERARELAILETMDGGKPIRESRDVDLPLVAQHFFYHAGWADKLEYLPLLRGGKTPAPVGVCGQIIPWNFPLLMAAWKIAPALACGNTVVLKPAETTPLTALRLAEICQEIDLPPGVVNIVTGDGRTGAAIVNHPGVDKIAFTGSTEVGKKIAAAVASTNKKLTLELGGKGANIIFDDASLDQAVEGIIEGIYFNQGHVCCAGSRLLVQEGVARKVIDKLTYRLASLRVGDPMDKNTDIGAINSAEQLARIQRYLTIGCEQGAQLVVGGAGSASGDAKDVQRLVASATRVGSGKGFYCRPCLLTGVQPAHTVAREEIFGPVLSVMTFRTPEEALLRANNTPYGLGTGVWTDKGSKILELARKLEAGIVWLNTYNKFDAASPFGGYKESGFGREGGVHGLRGYVK
jgi:aldehyde dehydrogenase (NAD+)